MGTSCEERSLMYTVDLRGREDIEILFFFSTVGISPKFVQINGVVK